VIAEKPKRFVLIRDEHGLWVMTREWYTEHVLHSPNKRKAEVIAEADEMLSLMRFKALTKEET
jgi:hypothetical protein